MKIHSQIILKEGIPVFAVLPYDEYQQLIDLLDDAEDVDAVSLSKHDSSERFPLALVEQIASGGNPIKCFREYRKLSQTALALRVNISRQYMSQIESGDRQGTTQLMKKIASVLGVDLDDLVS